MIGIISAFSFFFLVTFDLSVHGCQPMPSREQMEQIRERLRTALIVLPPVELRNLTEAQIRTLNQTIEQLVRLRTVADKTPYSLDPELLRAAQIYANQLKYENAH